jgi:hypothetical protein
VVVLVLNEEMVIHNLLHRLVCSIQTDGLEMPVVLAVSVIIKLTYFWDDQNIDDFVHL